MTTHSTKLGTIELLLRRVKVLGNVLEGSKSNQTLANEVETSRSTADRAVEKLASGKLVKYRKDSGEGDVQTNQADGQRSERVAH